MEAAMVDDERNRLIALLSAGDEEERREAMAALKGELAESDLGWGRIALSDGSWRVRKEAIDGFSRLMPTAELVATLVPLLHPDHEVILRNSVTEVLEKLGPPVLPALIPHLATDQPDVRKFLVDICGNIADPRAIDPLIALLSDPVDNVRAAAAEGLARIGDRRAARALVEALEGADDWTAYSILGALGKIMTPEALPLFFRNMEKGILAIPCIQGVGAMGSPSEGLLLMEKVPRMPRGPAKVAFLAAARIFRRALPGLGGFAAVRPLMVAVSRAADAPIVDFLRSQLEVSDSLEARRDFVMALGMIGTRPAVDALIAQVAGQDLEEDLTAALFAAAIDDGSILAELLTHPDDLVRRRGLAVLLRIGDRRHLKLTYPLMGDENGHVRQAAIHAIAQLGSAEDLDPLLGLLTDGYSDVREAAAEALVTLGRKVPRELVGKVEKMGSGGSPSTRALLLRILSEVDPSRHLAVFQKASGDVEAEVRAAGIRGLARTRDPRASSLIITALADECADVRVEAANALGETTAPGALPALMAAARDTDPSVRAAAIGSLGRQPGLNPDDLVSLLREGDVLSQTAIVEVLGARGEKGEPRPVEILQNAWHGAPVEVAQEICRVMGRIPGLRALTFLLTASRRGETEVRLFTAYALASRPEVEARARLAEMSENDPDRTLREVARHLAGGRG
jgi:HEAT repeat protein